MGRKAFVALSVCLLALGLAAFVSGDGDTGHAEPSQAGSTYFSTSALVSLAAVNDGRLSGYDVDVKLSSNSDYTLANPSFVTATQYLVTGLVSATSYDFGVVATHNDGHVSAMSIPATCTTN